MSTSYKKFFKRADFILLAVFIVIGLAASAVLTLGGDSGNTVEITVGGELYGTYPLSVDRTIVVSDDPDADGADYNSVEIKDGSVRVTSASCKNQVCVKHDAITRSGESIICLPNKMVVTITGEEGNEIDAISN